MSNAAIERMITDRIDVAIAAERIATAAKAAKVTRATAAAEKTKAAATVGGAGRFNNTGPATGVGGPNVVGPTVGAVGINVVPEVRGCSYIEFMKCEPTKFKGTEGAGNVTSFDPTTIDEAMRMARRLMDQVVRAGTVLVKENQEKDKIGLKPDKNGKRGEAQKSQK
uniref:Reverse transcriptase domain-containing protein n=1 Tax=Tanacetum cinerariifolium TaxID=118510 RepID=A0A6L2MXD6_TANCI|nr:hypothetical protein [Tanacetum cinerariifolium]